LYLVSSGVNEADGLSFPKQSYNVAYPCDDLVCYYMWHFSTTETSHYTAIVSNGEVRTATSEDDEDDEGSKCTLQIEDLTKEAVGHSRCQSGPDVSHYSNTSPELKLIPGKSVSLQCILLGYLELKDCDALLQPGNLMWVDEAGAKIEEDPQHQITLRSPCDITLTVAYQSPVNKKFHCQVTVDEQVHTSVEFRVRVLDGNQNVVGAAVGVVGCVVSTALVAAFVVNKRRTRNQLPEDSQFTASTNNVMNADDVIYADILVPVGSGVVWVQECESTEYACVRYK
ncbi:hypothetical protein GBF38_005878, partial [Nibea albiflora]